MEKLSEQYNPKFNEQKYTNTQTVKELLLIQGHAQDGSALEGCLCIPKKHFYKLEALSEEGMLLMDNAQEKEFYGKLAVLARELRKAIADETWKFPDSIKVVSESRSHTVKHALDEEKEVKKEAEAEKKLEEKEEDDDEARAFKKCVFELTPECKGGKCNPVKLCHQRDL